MYLAFLPLIALCEALGTPAILGYFATLFLADVVLLLLLLRRLPGRERLVLGTYWLSPIILVATYWLGRNDVLPVALLMGTLLLVRNARWGAAGFSLVAAVSAKLSMIIVLPFMVIYFLRNPTVRGSLSRFVGGALFGVLLLFGPIVASAAAWEMLFANPETEKLLAVGLATTQGLTVYLVPLVYVLMLYATWRVKRLNYPLLESTMGLSFLALVLLTPASPGWYVWLVPFLVVYQGSADGVARLLVATFGALFVVSSLVGVEGMGLVAAAMTDPPSFNGVGLEEVADSLVHTSLLAVGLVLGLRAWRDGVQRNDYLRLNRRPFLFGIAGDSGSGKDTLSQAIGGLFGGHSVTFISGDDYHLWDRQRPIWQALTHLNPSANDLERYVRDVHDLMNRKTVYSRHYDHESGRLSQLLPIKPNDFVIASGLHALYFSAVRDLCSVTIYLDMDEDLRRFLKTRRDVQERGHTPDAVQEALDSRQLDARKFVHPQKSQADLVFSVRALRTADLENTVMGQTPRLLLVVQANEGLSPRLLTRVLVGVCGLYVEFKASEGNLRTEFTIEGDCSAQDVALAASIACPRIRDFLDTEPLWQDGVLGIMQLLTLVQAEHSMTRSFAP